MVKRYTDEFRRVAVRIAISCGLTVARNRYAVSMKVAAAGFIRFGCRAFDTEQMRPAASIA